MKQREREQVARRTVDRELGRPVSDRAWRWLRRHPEYPALLDMPDDHWLARECLDLIRSYNAERQAAVQVRAMGGSDHARALATALSARAWASATVRPDVAAFRTTHLGGRLRDLADVQGWAADVARDEGARPAAGHAQIPLPRGDAWSNVHLQPYRAGGVLAELAELADALAGRYRWSGMADGVALVVADAAPLVQPATVERSDVTDGFVILRAHADLGPDDLAQLWAGARRLVRPHRTRSATPRSLSAAAFATFLTHSRHKSWPGLHSLWSKGQDDPYENWRAFRLAAMEGRKALGSTLTEEN